MGKVSTCTEDGQHIHVHKTNTPQPHLQPVISIRENQPKKARTSRCNTVLTDRHTSTINTSDRGPPNIKKKKKKPFSLKAPDIYPQVTI